MPTKSSRRTKSSDDPNRKGNDVIADEVIAGKWGRGEFVRTRLHNAGYDPDVILAEVERKLEGGDLPEPAPDRIKSIDEVAGEVLAGKWGNHDDRKLRLQDAGYDYDNVQRIVNQRIGGGAPQSYKSTLAEIAQQVIAGHFGEDEVEQKRLVEAQGWHYASVKAEVNRIR